MPNPAVVFWAAAWPSPLQNQLGTPIAYRAATLGLIDQGHSTTQHNHAHKKQNIGNPRRSHHCGRFLQSVTGIRAGCHHPRRGNHGRSSRGCRCRTYRRAASRRLGGVCEQRSQNSRCRLEDRRPRPRSQRMANDQHGPRVVHDTAWLGSFLRRSREVQECPLGSCHDDGHRRFGDHPLVPLRLQPHILGWQRLPRRPRPSMFQRHEARKCGRGLLLDLGLHLGHVPAHFRDHHPGPDLRCHGRAHEILCGSSFHGDLDVRRLLPARPHGLGCQRLHVRSSQS